ncbi:hypothetical protein KSP35_13030 [Aquihabitans sp. G128]|uniref:hypothetical protein n=1 Tax=Aquihabitans sp. G128 TaxID=2849779 RepID=UPI001C241EA9|nr:hypothetical protein [Aquihabitans sp. G128]QXC59326.1 hypothetical protein KSP35_13030 [Aquihabitans sp. G128]
MLKAMGLDPADVAKALAGTEAEFKAFQERARQGFEDAQGGKGSAENRRRIITGYAEFAASLGLIRDQSLGAAQGQADLDAANKALSVDSDKAAGSLGNQAGATGEVTDRSEEATKALEDQASAARGLFDARQAAAASAAGVLSAEQELADARRSAAGDSDEMRNALDGVEGAEKAVADAKRASREAEVSLSEARSQAADDLRHLEEAAAGAAVAEGRAKLTLKEALRDQFLVKPGTDFFADAEAAQKVAEARQALAEAQTKKGDTAQELADARAKGIEGSDAVVAAQKRIRDSYDGEREAQKRLADASDQVAKVRADAADKVRSATAKLTEAQLDNIDKQAELTEKVFGAEAGNQALLDGLFRLAVSLDPANPLRQRLGGFITDLLALRAAYDGSDPVVAAVALGQAALTQKNPKRLDGGRAQGGPVYPGRAYSVNEMARYGVPSEVFVPDVPGRIVQGSQAPGVAPVINMPVQVLGNPDAATIAEFEKAGGRMINEALRQYSRNLR